MKELIPLHDNLIVRPAGVQKEIIHGSLRLDIPGQHQKKFSKGTVVDKGSSRQIEEGDEVTYPLHTETPIDVDGQHYVIVSESQCLAIVREKKPTPLGLQDQYLKLAK